MHPQAMADLFARLGKPRLMELLKLKSVQHLYDPTPGRAPARFLHEGVEIALDKMVKAVQPYKDIGRFVADERVMTYVIDPGLVPIVKSILLDIRGRRFLVTRRVASKALSEGAVAHLQGFGLRVALSFDENSQETEVVWECLYGVA
jgi:hypothetical protein